MRLDDRSLIKVARANVSPNGEPPFAVGDVVWVTWPSEAGVVLREQGGFTSLRVRGEIGARSAPGE